MHLTWRKLSSLLLAALLLFGIAACGDDDDDDVATGDDTEEPADDGSENEGEDGEEGGPPDTNPCAEGASAEDAGLPPSEEPAEGATAITVTAKEYEFVGADALSAGGKFAITLENEGAELHEMVVQHVDESETRTLEEMMQSEEPPDTLTQVGFGFACPGDSTVFNVDLTEPGRYVALCFIPVGTTPETKPEEFEQGGPPHAANGMVLEFQVEA